MLSRVKKKNTFYWCNDNNVFLIISKANILLGFKRITFFLLPNDNFFRQIFISNVVLYIQIFNTYTNLQHFFQEIFQIFRDGQTNRNLSRTVFGMELIENFKILIKMHH